ncbi:MAG TPA: XrtA/PEP-CTERM system histidine kinase PrsK, partial [Pseudodesulfovibrio sp.]|nr:XrtA/PEP-CTERM system histidine kinase PrsK [Pseudodesulfovibrio sp.]
IGWEDCDLLKTAGRQVASYLGQLRATEALYAARQFETFNRYTTYVIHDLKNITAQLSLVVSNAARHRHNPEFMEDAIRTVENSVKKMHHLLVQLRTGRDKGNDAPKKSINLVAALQEVVESRRVQRPAPSFSCEEREMLVWTEPTRLGSVIGHVIQNAQEATPPDGRIEVRLYKKGDDAVIEVTDTGCGMDAQFIRDRLFRPFDSTKGQSGMGVGAYEVREWAREQGGDVDVQSEAGKGTLFRITLPNIREANRRPEAVGTSA